MTLLALALAVTAWPQTPAPSPLRANDPRTGTPIVLVSEEGMFPDSWVVPDISAKAVSLEPDQADRSIRLVEKALDRYPAALVKRELKKVYVLRKIEFYSLAYGGTNSLDTVYLTNQGPARGYSDGYITGSFHHEFSSILLRNHQSEFDESGWIGANPSSFKYGNGGTAALRDGHASTKYDPALAADGLLTQYSKASVEEDFNMVVEGLFSGDKEFWAIVDRYPRVKTKVGLAVKLYSGLDPQFGEAYFRSLAKSG